MESSPLAEPQSPAQSLDASSILSVRPAPSEELLRALRHGTAVADRAFDRFLPFELQAVSGRYWTPLVVAARAAQWFERVGARSVVDIGSGAGKFCVAAALASRCHYTGLERRSQLVAAAQQLSWTFGVEDRVRFVLGTFGEVETPVADAYYVYNPFEENLFASDFRLDHAIDHSPARYARDISAMTELLQGADVGTYLLTYNGFGGSIPATYEEVYVDRTLPNVMRLWRKARRTSGARPFSANAR